MQNYNWKLKTYLNASVSDSEENSLKLCTEHTQKALLNISLKSSVAFIASIVCKKCEKDFIKLVFLDFLLKG